MSEPFIDKSIPARAAMCAECKHEKVAGNVWPCSGCWNPAGDMFEPKPAIDWQQRALQAEARIAKLKVTIAKMGEVNFQLTQEIAKGEPK